MKPDNLAIYILEALPIEERWQVRRWERHRVLIPIGMTQHTVSTQAGDVDLYLYLPFAFTRDRAVLLWACAEVQRLHPLPTDLDTLDTLTLAEKFRLALDFALEFIELVDDGRGNNERARYLIRCLRQITSTTPTPVGSTANSDERSSDAQADIDASGDQDE